MKCCIICQNEIPAERLEALPNTETCVKCSDKVTQRYVGFMVFAHKTAGECSIVNPSNKEVLRQAKRFNERAR